jgi:hypothetical protein
LNFFFYFLFQSPVLHCIFHFYEKSASFLRKYLAEKRQSLNIFVQTGLFFASKGKNLLKTKRFFPILQKNAPTDPKSAAELFCTLLRILALTVLGQAHIP